MLERPARSVIFDVEGTLVDCVPLVLKSWRRTLEDYGQRIALHELHRYAGMDGGRILDLVLANAPKSINNEGIKKRMLREQRERYRREFIRLARSIAGVRDLVLTLRERGYRIGIATSCEPEELACYDGSMRILELCDAVVSGGEVRHGKPDPEVFRSILLKLQLYEPSLAVAVGDTPYDAIGARAMGLQPVGVLTGGFSRKDLRAAGCRVVLSQVRNLAVSLSASVSASVAPRVVRA